MASKSGSYAATLIMRQFGELQKNPCEGISIGLADDDNLFEWNVCIIGPAESMYEGGFFKAKLQFPEDFPNSPPVMRFTSQMWHPNSEYTCAANETLSAFELATLRHRPS